MLNLSFNLLLFGKISTFYFVFHMFPLLKLIIFVGSWSELARSPTFSVRAIAQVNWTLYLNPKFCITYTIVATPLNETCCLTIIMKTFDNRSRSNPSSNSQHWYHCWVMRGARWIIQIGSRTITQMSWILHLN